LTTEILNSHKLEPHLLRSETKLLKIKDLGVLGLIYLTYSTLALRPKSRSFVFLYLQPLRRSQASRARSKLFHQSRSAKLT
jgi:hypothetical protein